MLYTIGFPKPIIHYSFVNPEFPARYIELKLCHYLLTLILILDDVALSSNIYLAIARISFRWTCTGV